MAFTFNWAGMNTPKIALKDRDQQMRDDASAWGRAVRGYVEDRANKEYADVLDARARATQIEARIAQLQARNKEIVQELSANTPVAVEPIPQYQPGPAFVSTPENPTPANYPYSNDLRHNPTVTKG